MNRIKKPIVKGLHRLNWDLDYPSPMPADLNSSRDFGGPPVLPGKYSVSVEKFIKRELTPVDDTRNFTVKRLENTSLPPADNETMKKFTKRLVEMVRVVQGTLNSTNEISDKLKHIKLALHNTPAASPELMAKAMSIEREIKGILRVLSGDRTLRRHYEPQPPSVSSRVNRMIFSLRRFNGVPTNTMIEQLDIAEELLKPQMEKLQKLVKKDIVELEKSMEELKAPWTPGRLHQLDD